MALRHCISAVALLFACSAHATDVAVVGLFSNKAVVQINGGATRTLSVGQKTAEGVVLVSVERDAATLEVDGQRRVLKLGQQHASSASASQTVRVAADANGHFVTDGQVNGTPMRFLVDTGATLVALSSADAEKLRIDYRKGRLGLTNTAGGQVKAWRVTLDTVRVGDISLNNVEAVVVETPGLSPLLGMSFLNRTDMHREGAMLTLIRRY